MLNGIRKNTKLIVWSTVICLALLGGFSVGVQFQKKGRVAGEVFEKNISFQEYESFYRANQIFSFTGKPPDDPDALRQVTWETIIYAREAKRLKLEVSDEEVRTEVLRILSGQKIENPDMQTYRRWLNATVRETPKEFESQIREWLRIQKLIRKVREEQKPVNPTEEEIRERFMMDKTMIAGEMIAFKTPYTAVKFKNEAKTPADWAENAKKQNLTIQKKELTPSGEWISLLNIAESEKAAFLKLSKGEIAAPFLANNEYLLIRVTDKKAPDEAEYEKSLRQKYIDEINERKSYESFLLWHQDLLKRANLKDHQPKPEDAVQVPAQAAAPIAKS